MSVFKMILLPFSLAAQLALMIYGGFAWIAMLSAPTLFGIAFVSAGTMLFAKQIAIIFFVILFGIAAFAAWLGRKQLREAEELVKMMQK
jgi:hypothetical protein